MYDVFYFYSIFIYGKKPYFTLREEEDGFRVTTAVCGTLIVCWGDDLNEIRDTISTKAVEIIKDNMRPYDEFEKAVWDKE